MVSDGFGHVFEIADYEAAGMRLFQSERIPSGEWIPLPIGSDIMELPGRIPVAFDRRTSSWASPQTHNGLPIMAVAAFAAPAYTLLYLAAYRTEAGAPVLPLFAYAPVGWRDGLFWIPAVRVDSDVRHDPDRFRANAVLKAAERMLQKHVGNRLVEHLVRHCVRHYRCPNAQNFVLERWECPVPISPSCTAECVGCISEQSASNVKPTQNRISFVPSVEEILEFAVPHLKTAARAMISFGQGCEGEPLMQSRLVERVIRQIRMATQRGTIHLNTNASDPEAVDRLFRAGLDSIRVSLNSARQDDYSRYFRPKTYGFPDVIESLKIARKCRAWISLNYLIFPGLTDHPDEIEALLALLKNFRIDCIQTRNLNIDPEQYMRTLQLQQEDIPASIGILKWMALIRREVPWIRLGYFNPPKEDWGTRSG